MAKKKAAAKGAKNKRVSGAAATAADLKKMSRAVLLHEQQRLRKDPDDGAFEPPTPEEAAQRFYSSMVADAEIEIQAAPGLDEQATLEKVKQAGAPLPASSRHPMTRVETGRETASSTHASTAAGGEDGSGGGASGPGGGVGVPEEMLEALREASPAQDLFAASSGGPTAFHDFAAYEFLFDPWGPAERAVEANAGDMSYFDSMSGSLDPVDAAAVRRIYVELTARARRQLGARLAAGGALEGVMRAFRANLLAWGMPIVFAPLAALGAGLWRHFVDSELEPWLHDWARETAATGAPARISASSWGYLADAAQEIARRAAGRSEAPLFIPYTIDTVNFGMRMTYRQEWKSLGDQYGDIARTIPLGPRQSEKVSVKILKRNKGTRQMETTEATETESEVSNTVKSSSEIVEEAANSNKWHAEAELSGSVDTVGASASAKIAGGASGESSANSKNTKSRLGEAMQKSAHKMRRETKVTVATETEVSFQEERSSEIVNPNDEIAVTYVYQRLQRQYEIHTYLAEAASVVYVAEYVPPPGRLEAWIKRYAWIVGEVLLDDSYRDVLNLIANEAPRPDDAFGEQSHFESFVKNAAGSMTNIAAIGGTLTNLFDATQKTYADVSRERREDGRYRDNLAVRRVRFLQHVEDNILHYCRSVWSREDSEQRMMRYARVMVPADIALVPVPGGRPQWQPSPVASTYVPLSKLINPAGPIGYSGNYAVFYLREDPKLVKHNMALQVMSAPYYESLGYDAVPAASNASAGARLSVSLTLNSPAGQLLQLLLLRRLTVKVAAASGGGLQVVLAADFPGIGSAPLPAQPLPASGVVSYGGVLELRFSPMPAAGDEFVVSNVARFRDPELAATARDNPLPSAGSAQETALFSTALVDDMLRMMPGLRNRVEESFAAAATDRRLLWSVFSAEQRGFLRAEYHAYLLRKEHTRRFLVDTNSLVLNLIPGTGSALEPFKRAHRYIDVLKEANEVQRRKLLIDGHQYGDPDVEKVVLIGPGASSAFGAAVAGAESAVPVPAAPAPAGNNGTNGHNP